MLSDFVFLGHNTIEHIVFTGYEFDAGSGYYYNKSNGFYYDANTGLYYSNDIGTFFKTCSFAKHFLICVRSLYFVGEFMDFFFPRFNYY